MLKISPILTLVQVAKIPIGIASPLQNGIDHIFTPMTQLGLQKPIIMAAAKLIFVLKVRRVRKLAWLSSFMDMARLLMARLGALP